MFDMLASIDINNFDLIGININEKTGEMAEVVDQVGGNDQEAVANENGDVLENDQLPAVDDDIGELARRFQDLTMEQSDGCAVRYSITFMALQTVEDGVEKLCAICFNLYTIRHHYADAEYRHIDVHTTCGFGEMGQNYCRVLTLAKAQWKRLSETFKKKPTEMPVKHLEDGVEDEDDEKPTWQYFDSLLFLKDQYVPRHSTGNFDMSNSEDTEEACEVNSMDEVTKLPPSVSSENPKSVSSTTNSKIPEAKDELPNKTNKRKVTMLAFDENGKQISNNEIINTRSNTTQRKDSTSESCSTKNPKPWVQETNIPTSNKFEVLNIPEPNESNFQEQMESDLVDHDSEYPIIN
ncbi:hypothetical protein JTB14_016552 [Gonioctena quinquepunctata]|nr:hypothetical protein JTB14_016552 [Gonioctena quinquepunctata]